MSPNSFKKYANGNDVKSRNGNENQNDSTILIHDDATAAATAAADGDANANDGGLVAAAKSRLGYLFIQDEEVSGQISKRLEKFTCW